VQPASPSPAALPLQNLIDEFLAEEFEAQPVAASGLGLTEYDDRLDDLSAAAFRRRDDDASRWRERFAAVPDAALDPQSAIDRDLALAGLRGREILADWENWRRDPQLYTGPILQGVFGLFLHRIRPDAELAAAAVARLAEAPRALEQGIANLSAELAHPLILRRGAGAARGGARYLRELLPAELAPGQERDRLAEAGARAANALDRWIAHLDDLAGRATGSWQLGEERYSRLLLEREALPYDARQLREIGRQEYDRLDMEMRQIARTLEGDEDWAHVLDAANADHPATEEDMRGGYEAWTERAREFLAATGLVTLPPGERCLVEPSPVFQRPVLGVASYAAPPAFSASFLGHFFVPFAPDGTPEEEVQERLAANSWGKIPTTSVHEAYPGHHWHLVMRKSQPSRIRKVFGTPYFNEGWALYAERVMRERGFFTDPLQELYHLNATIFRAARIVVDTSLHMDEMSHDEAVEFMSVKTALPEPTARAEVGRYCTWPTQASAYLTGCLQILGIRDRYLAARQVVGPAAAAPIGELRRFHDTIAASGSLPLGLADRAVMASLAGASSESPRG
jgi:uncharacterized protein (DUF885 family)